MGGSGSGYFGWRGGRPPCDSPSVRRISSAEELRSFAKPVSPRSSSSWGQGSVYACPGCDHRIRVLYQLATGRVGCRRCLCLTYRSQLLSPAKRLRQTANRLIARHGIVEHDGMCYRPHGMHRRTFDRVMDRVQELEAKANHAEGIPYWVERLLGRHGSR